MFYFGLSYMSFVISSLLVFCIEREFQTGICNKFLMTHWRSLDSMSLNQSIFHVHE